MEVIQVGTLPPGERFNYFLPNLFSGSKDFIYSHPSFTKNELHLPNHYFLVPTPYNLRDDAIANKALLCTK
jgi:hypothetical protein